MSVIGLERVLDQYLEKGDFEKPFDIKQVPLSTQPITINEPKKSALSNESPIKKEEKFKPTRKNYLNFKIYYFRANLIAARV